MPGNEIKFVGWDSTEPHVKFCAIPHQVSEKESHIYKALIGMHCSHSDKKSEHHECCGAITICAKTVTFRCKKCGDSRGIY